MRSIGLDLGRHTGEAALVEASGRAVRLGPVEVSVAGLAAFAALLRPDDRLALEASSNTWAIAERLAPHVAQVVVSNPLRTRAIAQAKTRTDEIDARTLAELLAADYLPEVWQARPGDPGACVAWSPSGPAWCAPGPGCATGSRRSSAGSSARAR